MTFREKIESLTKKQKPEHEQIQDLQEAVDELARSLAGAYENTGKLHERVSYLEKDARSRDVAESNWIGQISDRLVDIGKALKIARSCFRLLGARIDLVEAREERE